jgi:adenine-specific DNA-methyltransferase
VNKVEDEGKTKLRKLLRELFQFESEDLDFGIYRIMNFKKDQIAKFIDKDLVEEIAKQLNLLVEGERQALRKEIDDLKGKIREAFGDDAFKDGELKDQFKATPLGKKYEEKRQEIERVRVSEDLESAVYNHIHSFFSRYYDNGDFLSKRRFGKTKYVVPYNGEETLLHWATKDQYYVKTSKHFRKFSFEAGDLKINFRVLEAEEEAGNVKAEEKRLFILSPEKIWDYDKAKNELDIYFEFRSLVEDEKDKLGERVRQEDLNKFILEAIERELGNRKEFSGLFEKRISTVTLEKQLNKYTKRNTMDYFVHKDLKPFLEQELDFYIKNEVLNLQDIEKLDKEEFNLYLLKSQVIKNISLKIIQLLAQIEDFQRYLFRKKKFVVRTDYGVTLDRVPDTFYEEILRNNEQTEEWKRLYRLEKGTIDKKFLHLHQSMMIDTKHYDEDFKERLLETFENLDEETNGILIHSENFQALNLLLKRFRDEVKCVYIDPPYNTGSDEFLYKDNYRHSSWLSMMADRLQKAEDLITKDGVIFVNIDDNEHSHLMTLMRTIFTALSEIPTFIWKKKGTSTNVRGTQVSSLTDYIIAFGGNASINPRVTPRERRNYPYRDENGRYRTTIIEKKHAGVYERASMRFEILGHEPRPGKRWQIGTDKARALEGKNRFIIEKGIVKLKIYDFEDHDTLSANPNLLANHGSTDSASRLLTNMFGIPEIYNNPKPIELIEHLIAIGTKPKNSIVLDFFAGSGTTGHAVITLNAKDNGNRKYILIEMGDYFNSVMLPRIKKAVYSDSWKDGVPQSISDHSHMFKYQRLEQYEDALENISFEQKKLLEFEDYFVEYMLDFETKQSKTFLNIDEMEDPFNYKLKIMENCEPKTVNVDLVETFNYLIGLSINKLKVLDKKGRKYVFVFGETDSRKTLAVWRSIKDIDFEDDKKVISAAIADFKPDEIYVNGDCIMKGFKQIENEFKTLLFRD